MTVAKEAPLAIFSSLLKELEGLLRLTLTKGNGIDLNTKFLRVLLNNIGGINTLRQDDQDWCRWRRCGVNVFNLSCLGLDELILAEVRLDVLAHGEDDSIRSETPENDHLAEWVLTFSFPLTWKLAFLGALSLVAVPSLPFLGAELNGLADVSEGWENLIKLNQMVPGALLDPVSVRLG